MPLFYSTNKFIKLIQIFISHKLSIKCALNNTSQRLYNLGARKMVLAGSGPLGCIPSQLSMVRGKNSSGCVTKINNLISMFNSRLQDLPNTLNKTLPGSFFIYQNFYDLFHDMVVNPSRYGKKCHQSIYSIRRLPLITIQKLKS